MTDFQRKIQEWALQVHNISVSIMEELHRLPRDNDFTIQLEATAKILNSASEELGLSAELEPMHDKLECHVFVEQGMREYLCSRHFSMEFKVGVDGNYIYNPSPRTPEEAWYIGVHRFEEKDDHD